MRILVANRGEIARRIIRTAHRLGHETVAIFAEPDRHAPYVAEATVAQHIGPANLAESYLSVERVMSAATQTGADAIHPGYGFLAENATFAEMCKQAGLIWIGPNPEVIASMGSKIEARKIADSAGVPTIPGWSDSQEPAALYQAAERIGFPVLIKASAGGGGKGIRIANDAAGFEAARAAAAAEAQNAFGDPSVIVERYIQRPRHIEVQVIGDRFGTVAELGTRECSVQRRYQKLLEEAPAPNLADETRHGLRDSAQALAKAVGYDSAGTVEFIVDDETGQHYFLEMNTRLQVEHPVTEMITGLDLVELMIRVAAGEPLPLDPSQLRFNGHSIEVRILAEDSANGFVPQTGTVKQIRVPANVRWDAAIEAGTTITPHYDSMIAKLVVHGATRTEALAKMRRALDHLIIDGVATTAGFHRWLLDQDPVIAGRVTTRFLDENPIPNDGPTIKDQPADDDSNRQQVNDRNFVRLAAAGAWFREVDAATPSTSPWIGSEFSLTPRPGYRSLQLVSDHGHEITPFDHWTDVDKLPTAPAAVDLANRWVAINHRGHTYSFATPTRSEFWAPKREHRQSTGDAVVAPFPAVVSEVLVRAQDDVEADQPLVVIEAMKMLHSLRANGAATVAVVRVEPGDQVSTGDVLVTFTNPTSEQDES